VILHSGSGAPSDGQYASVGAAIVSTPKRVVVLTVIGLAIAAMHSSIASAARNSGGCGEYRYYHGGRCVDARGSGAGPPSHWHPYDPSNSIH
jgi:hypothetical protein